MNDSNNSSQKMVPFVGPNKLRPGEGEAHGLKDIIGSSFTRPLESVTKEVTDVMSSIQEILAAIKTKKPLGFGLDTIDISLGFDAKGKLSFIAEGGVQATVKIIFKKM